MSEHRTFSAQDVIRFWLKNLSVDEQRFVLGYFWSLHPDFRPEKRIFEALLDLLGLIPVVGEVFELFELTLSVTDAIVALAELINAPVVPLPIPEVLPETFEDELKQCQQLIEILSEEIGGKNDQISQLMLQIDQQSQTLQDLSFQVSIAGSEIQDLEGDLDALFLRLLQVREFALQTRDDLIAFMEEDPTGDPILEALDLNPLYLNRSTYVNELNLL